jgi:maltose-binding protein MalE
VRCTPQSDDTNHDSTLLRVWYLTNSSGILPAIEHAASGFKQLNAAVAYKACTPLELQLLASGGISHDVPDVIILPSEYLATLASRNIIQRSSSQSDIDILPAMQACIWKGASWATPLACDTRMLFINKNVLRADLPIATHVSLPTVVSDPSVFRDSVDQFWASHGDEPRMLYRSVVSWLNMFGAEVFDRNHRPVLTSKANIQALESYAELAREGTTETERYLDGAFRQGSLRFWYGRASLIRDTLVRKSNNWLIRELWYNEITRQTPLVHTTVACTTIHSKKASLAKQYVQAVKQKIEHLPVAGFPTSRSFWMAAVDSTSNGMALIAHAMMRGRCIPAQTQWDEVCMIIEQAYTRVLYGLQEPSESLHQAQNELLALVP